MNIRLSRAPKSVAPVEAGRRFRVDDRCFGDLFTDSISWISYASTQTRQLANTGNQKLVEASIAAMEKPVTG
jgi:hypothetical protein